MPISQTDPLQRIPHRLAQLPSCPWFAYATILLLQLRRMWNLWNYRDLSGGDTAAYFEDAHSWFAHHLGNFAWSPLYTWFYGLWLRLTPDAAVVTWMHRLAIALMAAALVLAVLRRMLPAPAAWLMAAWWAVLSINFDTVFEVHLFSVLPLLLAWWAILALPGAWGRGTAIALLVLSGLLVRNESMGAAAVLVVICAIAEWRRSKRHQTNVTRPHAFSRVLPYLLPLVLTLAICAWFYQHSYVKGPGLAQELHDKHVVNMGQVYAVGYLQRHPEWPQNPWQEFGPLCQRVFGVQQPTLWQMIGHNPAAYARHVLWNYSLLPSGLQIMLFDATSGSRNPDYFAGRLNRRYPIVLSAIVLAILIAGAIVFGRDRRDGWQTLICPTRWGWAVMAGVAAVALLLVVPTQRPRPSYLFGLTVILMCLVGMALTVLLGRRRWMKQLAPLMPIVMIALPFCVPSAYGTPDRHGSRPLYDDYERLVPYQYLISNPDVKFLGLFASETQAYVGLGTGAADRCKDYTEFARLRAGQSLASFLQQNNIAVFEWGGQQQFLLESKHPGLLRDFLDSAGASGWRLIGMQQDRREPWLLFQRTPGIVYPPAITGIDLTYTAHAFYGWTPGSGWLNLQNAHPTIHPPEPVTRWGLLPGSDIWIDDPGAPATLHLSGTSPTPGQQITISLDGQRIGQYPISSSSYTDLSIPIHPANGAHRIRFDYAVAEASNDGPRAVKFRRIEVIYRH